MSQTNWNDFAPVDDKGAQQPKATPESVNWSDFAPADETPSRGFGGWARDIGATAVKGAIGVPEALVGLADIPTGGRVGKFLENEGGAVGFRPKQAKEIVNDWHSDATKEAQRKFQEADGIVDKAATAIQNPSLIATAVGESLPSMGAGGVAARGLMAATRLGQMGAKGAALAGAAGEGIAGAGAAAEQTRQETDDGLLTPGQAAAAAGTGVATAGFGALGGKIANRLGIGDAETMLAQGNQGIAKQFADDASRAATNPLVQQQAVKSIPRQVIEGAVAEGFLEELPQSVAEQVFQNLALDKPWYEDVDAAVVMGTLSGAAMGGAAAGYRGFREPSAPEQQPVQPGQPPQPAPQQPAPNPGLDMVRQSYEAQLQALREQEQGEPAVPQTTPPDGAAVLAQQRAQAEAERQAAIEASRAVVSPDDEIYQSTGMAQMTPSQRMGLRSGPESGALESAAALAVDAGATAQLQQAAAQAQAQAQATEAAKKVKPAKKKTAQAADVDPQTGEIASGMAAWSDADLSTAFRGAQSRDVRLQLAKELQRRRAARAETTSASGTEDAGTTPAITAATTGAMTDGPQAAQAQQAIAQPAQAGNPTPAAGAADTGAAAAPAAGGSSLQAAGLTDGRATTQDVRAQAAPEGGTQGAAPSGPAKAKAIERVKAGKAFFFSEGKAQAFMADNGLADSHEVVRKNRAFHVRARPAADVRQFTPETGTLGIPRAEMPQVPTASHGGLVKHLNAQGIAHETTTVDAAALKPTQAEYSPAKVEAAKAAGGDRAVIVSSDGHIIDGHHQAMAAAEDGKPVKAIVLDAPVEQALEAVKASPSAQQTAQMTKALQARWDAAAESQGAPSQGGAAPVASMFTGKADPKNTPPMPELEGFKPGDSVDVSGRTIGRSTVESVYRRELAGFEPVAMARIVGAGGKKLDVLTSELAHADAPQESGQKPDDTGADKAQAAIKTEADKDGNTVLGRRKDGVMIRQDKNGVRWYAKDGVRISETVSMRPTRQGMQIERGELKPEFMTAAESEAAAPAPAAEATSQAAPAKTKPSADQVRAQADLMSALADLGDILGKNTRMNIVPEQEQKLLPVLTRVLDAAFRLGYHKFKDSAKFALDQIRTHLGDEAADALTLDHLQGAYIAMAGGKAGADTKRTVIDVETKAEIEAHVAAPADAAGIDAAEGAATMGATPAPTTESTNNADTVPGEQLSQDDPAAAASDAAAGNRNPQPLDDGLAQAREGADRGGSADGVSDRAGGGRADGVQRAGQPALGAARDRAAVRPERQPADPVAPAEDARQADPATAAQSPKPELDHTIDAEDIGKGGLTKKYRDNIAAIRVLKAMAAESRPATPDERKTIARYVGWGALKGVFDPANKQWSREFAELRELLTDAEYKAARASTLNAHFTSPDVVKAIFKGLERMGFTRGRVLEPSVGVGNFFGLMPASMRKGSRLHGVELDPLTSQIVAALYPSAKIAQATGFQDFEVPGGYFDAAIGNPPFGSEPIVDDARSPYSGFSIHNYFFAKSIDKLRQGGLMAMVVSHNFLDARNDAARRWIAERAHLVSAVRLPNTAFKENAGTEVVTDIVVFQRKSESEQANGLGSDAWVKAGTQALANPKTGEVTEHSVSQYFLDNTDNVLGTPTAAGSMYRAGEYTVEPNGRLAEQLEAWTQRLPQGLYQPVERTHEMEAADVAIPDGVKVGSYFVDAKGQVQLRGEDVMGARQATPWAAPNAKAQERMAGMIGLRDALRTQMRLERSPDATEEQIEASRSDLNAKYDAFQKAYGYVNDPTNRRIFLDDTESPLLLALEFDYDRGVSKAVAEREDIEPRAPSAKKADIFQRRVMFPPADNIKVSSARDALLASLNYKGRLDLGYMASLYDGKPEAEIIKELGEVVFHDPIAGLVMADEYLSGDVKTKLAEAEAAALDNPALKRNVEALKKVIPLDKRPSEIHAAMGASFVPAEYFEQFAKEVTGADARAVYVKATGQWLVQFTGQANPALDVGKWGIDKMPASAIFTRSMAGQGVVVTETRRNADGSTTTVVLEKETAAAREKQAAMKTEWQRWLWADAERADKLAAIYNEKMNRIVPRKYDGSHMTFPGMSPAMELLPHQKNAVWRALQSRQVLLDHVVGAGKTFEVVALFMEMRRLGIARKPFIAVPNHLTLQWRSEFSRLYPAANVLAATPDDFKKENRAKFFSKIVTGDWDAVIVGHSSLKKIGLPPATEKAILQEQIDEISGAIEDMKRARGDRNIVRDMEGIKARLEARMKTRLQAVGERDKVVTFDELGVDAFGIDELHEFKNLFYNSTMERVPGMGNPAGSDKAFDLFVKLQWMFETYGDKAPIAGATGTPVSNSLVEMFNMQRMLQYPSLKRDGLHVFDAWAKQFGSVEALYEVAPSGTGYRQSSRFAKFKNLPALMAQYQTFADTVTLDDLKAQEEARGRAFPVPKIAGGRPVNVVAKRSPQVASFMGVPQLTIEGGQVQFGHDANNPVRFQQNAEGTMWTAVATGTDADGKPYDYTLGAAKTEEDARLLAVEAALTPKIQVDPKSILGQFANLRQLNKETKGKVNALSLTGQANKAGLDYRLIDPSAPDFEGSKINLAVDRMMAAYHKWSADKGAQLVFCDLSVPLSARSGFAGKERRVYVREGGEIAHKKGTLHTVAGHEQLPFLVIKEGGKDSRSFAVYDAATGVRLHGGLPAKGIATDWAAQALADEGRRQRWIDARDAAGDLDQDAIDDYNNANEIDTEESEAISLEDIAGASGAQGFSVYDDIRAKLIARGVPEREIAFIHDYGTPAAKDKLFKQVKRGDVRFLLGSTPKMGAGTNVQDQLVGLHHIDAPWRPSDLEQREGRIIRRGNKFYERDPQGFEVEIYRYATEQTYDTRRWQILEHKARGIEQLRKYDGTLNEIDDIEGEAANSADMKAAASGDPLILEETRLRNDVRRLETLQASHADEKQTLVRRARDQQRFADEWGPRDLAELQKVKKVADASPPKKDGFVGVTVAGKHVAEREDAIKAMSAALRRVMTPEGATERFTYRGLEFTLEGNERYFELNSPTGNLETFRQDSGTLPSVAGFLTRFANYMGRLEPMIADLEAKIAQAKAQAAQQREQANQPFAQAAELDAAREAHKRVQRRLIAKGPDIPVNQRAQLQAALDKQRAALRAAGLGEALDEFMGGQDAAPFGTRQRPATGTPTDRAVMDMVREGRDAPDILRMIAGTSQSRFNKQIARLLIKTEASPEVSIGGDMGGGQGFKFLAKYSRRDNTLTMSDGALGQAEQIFLHEMIHAATLMSLDRKGLQSMQMRRLYEHVKQQGGAAGQYGMKNVGEFVAEAFTNPEFQRALKGMRAPSASRLQSAWDALVRILRSIVGLPDTSQDALSAALEIGARVMRENMRLRTSANIRAQAQEPDDAAHFGAADLRGLKTSAIDQIQQTLSHPGKVSVWDKTVGTMRNLAERAPAFKPVFESAQRFIDDVATLANEAADAAPRLLPRVDSWRDLNKKPISAADNKAIAKPLFEGTLLWARDVDGTPVTTEALNDKYRNEKADRKAQIMLATGKIQEGVLKMWRGLPLEQYETLINSRFESTILKPGVVWSAKELQSMFGLNDQQVGLYQEARAAVDRSIDITARADMLRVLGEAYAGMRDAVMEAGSLDDAMALLTETLQQEARDNPDSAARVLALNNEVVKRHEKAKDLMAYGYAPLSRFGRYTVDVVDQAGERQYFGMFESMREANQMAMKMRDTFKGAAVTQGTMSQEAFKLFAGITPESLEQFGEMLGLRGDGNEAKDKAFQAYLQLAKNNHSALKRLIHRKGIDGYSEDVGRVLASFVYSNARLGASALNAGTMENAIEAIPKEQGELRDVAMALRSYIQDPQEEGQAVRGMLFAQYLGGSVASAFVNMTQPFAVTMPWLSQFGGMKKAGAQLARAFKDMARAGTDKGFRYEADLANALKHAEDDGVVSPQEIHQLMAQARGTGSLRVGDGTKMGDARAAASNAWERTKVAWGQPFALAEQFNRRSTFIAAFRMAKEQGRKNPAEFARKAVLETQFLYSKANKGRFMRGAIGGTLMTFKTYSVSYLELLHRMWTQGGPEGKRAVGWAMAMLLLMGGAGGLPFMEDAEDLIDVIAQLMGYNVSAKQWRKQALRDIVGKELADFVEQGVSGLPGAPVDVSGRLGMGNLLPGTGLLLSKQNRERDLLEIAGPAGDLVARGFGGMRKALTGDVSGAALEVSPTAVRNAAKGIDMAASGIYKDTKGYKVIDTTLDEAIAKFAGFQPKSVAEVQEANSFMQRSKSFYIQTSSEIKAQWAKALFDKDDAALQRVRARLDAWNRDNPDQPIVVKMPDVWKRVREMGKDRTQRIAETAPKALRQQMRDMAREAG